MLDAKSLLFAVALGLAYLLSSCSVVGPDDEGIIYPGALDLPLVDLDGLRQTHPAPDSVNVLGYIVGARVCPEGARCLLPNGIFVSEYADREDGLFIPCSVPAYQEDVQYVFSVAFSERVLSNDTIRRNFGLIGMARAAVRLARPLRR